MEVEESFEELEESLISLCNEDGDGEDFLTKDLMVPNGNEEMFDLDNFFLVQPSNSLTTTDHVIDNKNLLVDVNGNKNKALHKFQDENIPPKDFNIVTVKQNKTLDLIFSPSRHSFNPSKCSSPLIPLRVISQRMIPFKESNCMQIDLLSNDKDYSKPTTEPSNLSFSIYCPNSVNSTSSLNNDGKVPNNAPKLEIKKCHELSPDSEITNNSPELETEKLVVINVSQNLNTAQKPIMEKCCDDHQFKRSDNFEILSNEQKLKAEIIDHSYNFDNEQEVSKSYDKFPSENSDNIESVNNIIKLSTDKSFPSTLNIDDDQKCNGYQKREIGKKMEFPLESSNDNEILKIVPEIETRKSFEFKFMSDTQNFKDAQKIKIEKSCGLFPCKNDDQNCNSDQKREIEKKMEFPLESSNDIEILKILPKIKTEQSFEFMLDIRYFKDAQKIKVEKSCGVFPCKNNDVEDFIEVQKKSELASIIDDGQNFNYAPKIEIKDGRDKFPCKDSNDIEIMNNVSKLETDNCSEFILVKDGNANVKDIFNYVPNVETKQSSELTLKINDDFIVIKDSNAPKPAVKKSYEIPFKSKNVQENQDNDDPDWEKIKNLSTVEDRYKQVRSCWKSCKVPDHNKNLTYHSFRKRRIQEIDPISKIIKSQKRPATSDLDGRGTKRARTKSVPCTFLLDTKIESVRKTKQIISEQIMKEMNNHLDSLQEYHINSENTVKSQLNNFYDSCGPNPFTSFFHEANSTSLHLLKHRHDLEMRDVTETYRHKIGNCNSQYDSQIDSLKKARLEVKNFCNFYKGLSLTSSDPTLLDEVQLQELNEIENVYDKYKLFYH